MNKNDYIIGTLPIKPQNKTNIGMLLSPTVMDYIGTVFDIRRNIGFNVLHSYEDKNVQLDGYLNYLDESGIKYDSVFVDKDNANRLLEIVEKMFFDGYLLVKNIKKIRCDCGRVDMISTQDNNAKLYKIKDGEIICNYCGTKCHEYIEKSLVFEIKTNNINTHITPQFLEKEMLEFSKKFNKTYKLVSKNRETGYSIDTIHGRFNIDIDFLWSNYFKLYEEKNQIYIASNHQLFNMYLMNYLAKTTSDKNLSFIATPYLNVKLDEAKRQYELRKLKEYKQLLLLYNLKWRAKDCNWSDSVTNYLKNISNTRIDNLYRSLIISSRQILELDSDMQLNMLIYKVLDKSTNMQNNIKIMKKLYKEGKL